MSSRFLILLAAVLAPLMPLPLLADGDPAASPEARAEKASSKPYDEHADAKLQIATAVEQARRDHRRVLVQWGGNWCSWCLRLHELYTSDKAIAKELQYEYELVFVDAGKGDKNLELGKSLGATFEKDGFPFLTILDGDGRPVANQETGSLEVKGPDGTSAGVKAGHNPAAVLKFLKDHEAPRVSASDVLASGLKEAKQSGRRVFLHFGAPWCSWCKRLEKWMRDPAVAPLLARDYVDVKIDVDRMTDGRKVEQKYNAKAETIGIPYVVFLDAEGIALADSIMKNGENTGFPGAPPELAHFQSMLQRGSQKLAAADIDSLMASLRAAAPKE